LSCPFPIGTLFGQWANSPGYPDGSLHFDRPIVPRCLECHGSYFESLAPPPNHYRKGSLVLGLRARSAMVRAGNTLPGTNRIRPRAMVRLRPSSIRPPFAQQADGCLRLMPRRRGNVHRPALSFTPGDDLKSIWPYPRLALQRLSTSTATRWSCWRQSRCFRSSNLTCTTCHDVHRPQREPAAFRNTVLAANKASQCGEYAKLGARIAANCVDCHMPLQKSELLFSQSNGQELRPLVRQSQDCDLPSPRLPRKLLKKQYL